ncbi:MAG: DEAD/DEAH box helicase family protein [Methylococcales bacterium]|nr:DEAD/DEAH box helicase family protein [Methylococcales bacterium]
MNEAETRAEHIDPALKAAGWGVVQHSRIRREYPITLGRLEGGGKRGKSLSADYVLEYRNTKLAVVEAKAWKYPLTEGVAQAKDYAGKLTVRFTYSTNGQGIYAIDMLTGKEGELSNYPTPEELWNATFAIQNAWRDRFAAIPFEDRGGYFKGRYYQDIAIERILDAISNGKSRILVTLATGTGKTFIAFQLAWKLFQSRWNLTDWQNESEPTRRPRILFLADRNILANQAYNAFSAFPDDALVRIEPSEINRRGRVPTNGSLFFTIFQSFMSGNTLRQAQGERVSDTVRGELVVPFFGINPACVSDTVRGELVVPFFGINPACVSDTVRGELVVPFFGINPACVSNTVRGELVEPQNTANFGEYPADFFDIIIIDECHRGGANDEGNWRKILEYFKPAVQLGLTATPKRKDNVDTYAYFGEPVFTYSLKDGINDGFLTPFRIKQIDTSLDEYVYTPDDTVIEGEIEAGKVYEEKDFNRSIEIVERERTRVELFLSQINQQEKTLVFCANQGHALLIRDLINQLSTSDNPNYCHHVTANDGALGEQYLRDFQDNEKTIPTILTTSQKLSTGVDARNVRNIVLMRPVNSMIEFKQIIGRGTRLYDGKAYFTVYDFVGAHHHFQDPEWDGEPQQPDACKKCDQYPCECEKQSPKPCKICGQSPCECEKQPCEKCEQLPCVCVKKTKVILADGKARNVQTSIATTFWHPDGTPMTGQQFMEELFGKLPEFFKNEDELRQLWSEPNTRQKLLEGLAEKGFGNAQLLEMQKIIEAENSDLFDVLAHVAYALPTLTREERATKAKIILSTHFNPKQTVFLDFVLSHYVSIGVEELETSKLKSLVQLKYGSIADAKADLGEPVEISGVFNGFQRFLYG